jgi:predicted RND superfamily exporter protein
VQDRRCHSLLLFVGFFIAQIPNFQLDASSDSLVLEGDNNLRYYQSIRKNYGSDDYLVISYQVKDNLLAPKQLKHLASLKKDLQAIEQVKSVTTILDVPLFQSPPLSLTDLTSKNISIENGNADLALAGKEFKTSALYKDNLVSKDGKTSAILVLLKDNEQFKERRQIRNKMRVKKANNKLSKAELTKLKSIEKQVTQDATVQSNLQDQTITQIRTTIDKYRDKASLFLGGLPMITTDIIG